MVDANDETLDSTEFKPREVWKQICRKYSSITHHWQGSLGEKQAPTPAMWENLLQQSSIFVYYGMETLSCRVNFDS